MSFSFERACTELIDAWPSTVSDALRGQIGPRIVRAEVACPDTDILAWLQAQPNEARTYWRDREGAFVMGGVGIAAKQFQRNNRNLGKFIQRIRKHLRPEYPRLRYYGGMRFDTVKARAQEWKAFGGLHFVIPAIELGQKGNVSYLACNALVPSLLEKKSTIATMCEQLEALQFPDVLPHASNPPIVSREDFPDQEDWCALVDGLLEKLDGDELKKIVLARKSVFTLDGQVDPVPLLRRLTEHTTRSYHFCFQLSHSTAFIGASPERLFKRQSSYLQSEALAGTRPRGKSPEEDAALGDELLHSDKERREHGYVLDHVRAIFDTHCRAVRGGDRPELLILRHCQHLLSRIEGMLSRPDCDDVLLEELHPTPAVGGVPTQQAVDLIRASEPTERGWYAGPVGWIGYDATEFAVAIRSALVVDDTVSVHSGAGIVAGSEPEAEWAEIENKMTNFLNVLQSSPSTHEEAPTLIARANNE